jgi:hypothetical protein
MSRPSIVVIGAGLAGSLVCNELVEDADVTLLEIGERDRIHYPPIRFDRKKLGHVNTFCFGGGGTTNLWHNGLIPIDRRDVVREDFREVLSDAQPFMDDAASRLYFRGRYSTAYATAVSDMTAVAESVGLGREGIDCLLYPKKHRPLTVDDRVNAVYSVDTIRFAVANGAIHTVHYSVNSSPRSVNPTAVIVAAGAMGTPRILGEIIRTSGHRHDALGRGFIDHPLGFVGKVRVKKGIADAVSRLSKLDCGDHEVQAVIRLKSDCGRYTCGAYFRPALTIHNSLAIYKYKSLLGATTGLTRLRNAASWKLLHPDIIAEVVSHVAGVHIPSRTYNILFVAEQRQGNSRIYYDRDGLRVDWAISADELEIYRSLLRKLSTMLSGVADAVNIETTITDDWLWSGAHHSGVTSLGDTAGELVDRNLRLKTCENVYVCDGSVIQEHSYANTGLTIAQLALRLTKQLRDRYAATGARAPRATPGSTSGDRA